MYKHYDTPMHNSYFTTNKTVDSRRNKILQKVENIQMFFKVRNKRDSR